MTFTELMVAICIVLVLVSILAPVGYKIVMKVDRYFDNIKVTHTFKTLQFTELSKAERDIIRKELGMDGYVGAQSK